MALTPQTNASLADIADVITSYDSFAICGHVSPDGDCLGSQLALYHALISLGKQVTCLLVKDEPLPASLSFMPGSESMVPACSFTGDVQVFVGLDVPTRERVGVDACAILDKCQDSITVDHHACDTTMCNHVYVDPDSPSASMLVWQLVKLLCEQPPIESAVCAYVGLTTDTGGFCFQNCNASAFACAAELVSYGVDPAFVATQVYQRKTLACLKLEAIAVDRMQLGRNGLYAISYTTADDLARLGAAKSDCETLIDVLRSLDGVRIACMLREQEGCLRGSLRAKDDTDVSALARKLGGGGHRAAAGFTMHMDLQEALPFMCEQIEALLDENSRAEHATAGEMVSL